MISWLVVPLILIVATVLGWLLLVLFYAQRPHLSIATGFAVLVLGTAVAGWLALLLAELGLFSIANVLLVWLLLAMVLGLLNWRGVRFVAGRTHESSPRELSGGSERVEAWLPPWLEKVALVVWMLVAGWLFFRPHEYILGGADAGVYVSLGAEIAQQGGFVREDATLAALAPELKAVLLRPLPTNPAADSYLMPGFYVTDAAAGQVTPQFYPLHPLWYAVAFGLMPTPLSGMQAELLLNGFWTLLATLAIYLTVRELLGWETAVFSLLALSILALQVWFARYPTTEALTQFLLWSGLWSVTRWLNGREPANLWAFLAGLALGEVFLVRIDIIILLPILGLFVLWLWGRGWQRVNNWFVVPLGLMVAHSLFHALALSAPYFYDHMGYGLRVAWRSWPLLLVAGLIGLLFLWGTRRLQGRFKGLQRFRQVALALLIGAVLLFALYGWFVRPFLFETTLRPDAYSGGQLPITNHENWRRFAWYLSPLGVWLGVFGACVMIWRVRRATAVLLASGLLFSAIYLWNIRANPHHIYAMRRYVPMVAPFFVVATAVLIDFLRQRLQKRWAIAGRLLALSVAVIWLGWLAWSARGFISQVDHQGLTAQLDDLNTHFDPQSVLLFNDQSAVGLGDFWGTPLKFVYGHDVFTLRELALLNVSPLAETIENWQNNGQIVYWIGDPAWIIDNEFSYSEDVVQIDSSHLEGSFEHKPQAIVTSMWTLRLHRISAE